jgi:DNA-binding YbaB/EbfC family protein
MGNMLKQAQQAQERIQKAQEDIEKYVATGESGGGMVKVTLAGSYQVEKVEIADAVFAGGDKEMAEDLVTAACNDAVRRIKEYSAERMAKATQGLPIPPGMKLPF